MGFRTRKLGENPKFQEKCKNRAKKNTTKKRTPRALENMYKMSYIVSKCIFYISETYGHFAKNADVTKVSKQSRSILIFQLRAKPPHAVQEKSTVVDRMRGFCSNVKNEGRS